MLRITSVLLGIVFYSWLPVALTSSAAAEEWTKAADGQIGPRQAPALFWFPQRKQFILLGGLVSHEHQGDRPYDVLAWDDSAKQWRNDLPPAAQARGEEFGPVSDPGFKSPYFELADRDGLARPQPQQALLGNQWAYAPWDGKVYALMCGRTLCYDPVARQWQDLQPSVGPASPTRSYKESLNWGALCADPVRREIVLFGGCGLPVAGGCPGTWVYSPERNEWRDLKLKVQPPPRAMSPLVFDPVSKKILLFGGDGLDQLRADTWLYDPETRTWEERRPAIGPAPRFGHALLFLPRSKKLLLIGGNGYTSSTSYQAMLYRRLPLEVWTYEVSGNAWTLISRAEQEIPRANPVRELAAAASEQDEVLLVTTQQGSSILPATWRTTIDAKPSDAAATTEWGVPAGTVEYRTGPYDPAWYQEEVSPTDAAATEKMLAKLPVNAWTALECPKWPLNRMGGGWSTVAFDSDRDQILHLGGGHSSYFGNDVAHYDVPTGRWSIACRPQFALNYNYDLSGPGPWAFNGAPWGNHNYRAYTYDPTCRRLVYLRGPSHTMLYDPQRQTWAFDEQVATPWPVSKYTTVLCSTPHGIVAWVQNPSPSSMGLFLLEAGRKWTALPTHGEPLPVTVTDGSTLTYDSRRDRLLMTTTSDKEPFGQVWAYDLKNGAVAKLDPAGMRSIQGKRFAREAVYLPNEDYLLMGYRLNGAVPLYDAAGNRWLAAEVPGAEFISREKTGASVDLGLAYDAKRNLVWAVMCQLKPGALQVLRLDRSSLATTPLE